MTTTYWTKRVLRQYYINRDAWDKRRRRPDYDFCTEEAIPIATHVEEVDCRIFGKSYAVYRGAEPFAVYHKDLSECSDSSLWPYEVCKEALRHKIDCPYKRGRLELRVLQEERQDADSEERHKLVVDLELRIGREYGIENYTIS